MLDSLHEDFPFRECQEREQPIVPDAELEFFRADQLGEEVVRFDGSVLQPGNHSQCLLTFQLMKVANCGVGPDHRPGLQSPNRFLTRS